MIEAYFWNDGQIKLLWLEFEPDSVNTLPIEISSLPMITFYWIDWIDWFLARIPDSTAILWVKIIDVIMVW
jgi:hypothetical protein